MRKKILKLLGVLAVFVFGGHADAQTPSLSIPQVRFVKNIDAGTPISVTVDDEGRIYAGQEDGTIRVMAPSGLNLMHWKGLDAEGHRILDEPAGLAYHDKKLYIIDRSTDKAAIFSPMGKYLESFGDGGDKNKEFHKPSGIYVYEDIIYISDQGNDRIQLFGPDGVYLRSIPVPSENSDSRLTIKGPMDVVVDHRGYMVVPCAGENRVKIIRPDGTCHHVLKNTGEPVAVAVAQDGFYVADEKDFRIKKYDFEGRFLFSFGAPGEGKTQFAGISGLWVDQGGKLYVADPKKGCIHIFYPRQGEAFAPWQAVPAETGVKWHADIPVRAGNICWAGPETLYAVDADSEAIVKITRGAVEQKIPLPNASPMAVATDKTDHIWVLDHENKRVIRLNKKGEEIFGFGGNGDRPGQFSQPVDMAVTQNGIIFVCDTKNRRVQAFNSDGILLHVFSKGKNAAPFEAPCAVILGDHGGIYVLDRKKGRITFFSAEGKPLFEFGEKGASPSGFMDPVDLAATPYEIFVLDAGTCRVKVFSRRGEFLRAFGSRGKGKGAFHKPIALAAGDANALFVCDRGNRRIQVLKNIYTPSIPSGFTVRGGMHAATLTWGKNNEPGITGYRIYRSRESAGPFKIIATTNKNEFTDTDVIPEKTYFYLVSALGMDGKESGKGRPLRAVPKKYIGTTPTDLRADAHPCAVDLSWSPAKEPFVIGHVVLREVAGKFKVTGTTQTNRFREEGLIPNTRYTYRVAPVSADGERGTAATITVTTPGFSGPPLEITVTELNGVFTSHVNAYETETIGEIRLVNNTCKPFSQIRVLFFINEFMDSPYEHEMDALPAGTANAQVLKAIFNTNILQVTKDITVQAQIRGTYYQEGQLEAFTRNPPIHIYEMHRMKWDQKNRLAGFITPHDPVLSEFTQAVIAQFDDAHDNVQRAAVIFDALGTMGVGASHASDTAPSRPKGLPDTIQYPRETLEQTSGKQADILVLYAAALESIGISTVVLVHQGRMEMLFSPGFGLSPESDATPDMFVIRGGMLWVPVNPSLLGSSFMKAWQAGSDQYGLVAPADWDVIDTKEAWKKYPPATLPSPEWMPPKIDREELLKRFPREMEAVRKMVIRCRTRSYQDLLSNNPANTHALMQIGIIRAKTGDMQSALEAFQKVLDLDPRHAGAHNNIANIRFLQGRYQDARNAYQRAVDLEPQDALIWVNLARCYQELNRAAQAGECFKKAMALDPNIATRFHTMSLELSGGL